MPLVLFRIVSKSNNSFVVISPVVQKYSLHDNLHNIKIYAYWLSKDSPHIWASSAAKFILKLSFLCMKIHSFKRSCYFLSFSVRKKGLYKGKSQPWPPFRQRGRIMDCYKAMFGILHCKTMHAFLFTILHRVSPVYIIIWLKNSGLHLYVHKWTAYVWMRLPECLLFAYVIHRHRRICPILTSHVHALAFVGQRSQIFVQQMPGHALLSVQKRLKFPFFCDKSRLEAHSSPSASRMLCMFVLCISFYLWRSGHSWGFNLFTLFLGRLRSPKQLTSTKCT